MYFSFDVVRWDLREDLTHPFDCLFHGELGTARLLSPCELLEESALVPSSPSDLAGTATIVHIPVRELDPREPISNVIELPHDPALVLRLPRSLSIATLSPLVPLGLTSRIKLSSWNPKHRSDCLLRDSVILIHSLISLPRILLVVLGLIRWRSSRTVRLHLSVSVSTADTNLLPAHWTILAAILNQLNHAELVEEVSAR